MAAAAQSTTTASQPAVFGLPQLPFGPARQGARGASALLFRQHCELVRRLDVAVQTQGSVSNAALDEEYSPAGALLPPSAYQPLLGRENVSPNVHGSSTERVSLSSLLATQHRVLTLD